MRAMVLGSWFVQASFGRKGGQIRWCRRVVPRSESPWVAIGGDEEWAVMWGGTGWGLLGGWVSLGRPRALAVLPPSLLSRVSNLLPLSEDDCLALLGESVGDQ